MLITYDTEVAKEVGADAASLFQSIQSFVFYNESNEKNFHDGEYWTYDTCKAISKRFPHLSERKISCNIDKLVDSGFIKKGNYNSVPFDRTMWYTLTEKGKTYAALTRREIREIHSTNSSNAFHENVKSDFTNLSNQISPNCETNTKYIPSDSPSNKPSNNKSTYGEFGNVKLTDDEYQKLIDRLGESRVKELIERLDLYVGSVGKKYDSHYLTIINWSKKPLNAVPSAPIDFREELKQKAAQRSDEVKAYFDQFRIG